MIKTSPHRLWPVNSAKPWVYYQEWNQVVFFHWEVPLEVLAPYVPKELTLDSFKGKYWVSLVAFTMNKVKFRYLPSWSFVSDFHEVNLRTYVTEQGKPGVFFLSIEGEKYISNFIAKQMSGLPYKKANISRQDQLFSSVNPNSNQSLKAEFKIGEVVKEKDELDIWLTERYSLYLVEKEIKYRYEIDHEEWQVQQVSFNQLQINYKIGDYVFGPAQRTHYSPGVKVLAWSREQLLSKLKT